MADSTVVDFSKMKVIELRKELKSRGLATNGDKSELVARLQAANDAHDESEYALDSDEIDSEGVLEDDTAAEISLDDSQAHDSLNDELGIIEEKKQTQPKSKSLKRKNSEVEHEKKTENGDKSGKKIVLQRPTSVPSEVRVDNEVKEAPSIVTGPIVAKNPVVITEDPKAKLESRAKRFGLPMSDEEKKEARKIRFGQAGAGATTAKAAVIDTSIDKLKKRAERFGQSVSKVMTDVEAQERLERRRARFGLAK